VSRWPGSSGEGIAPQELDVSIQAAEIVVRPALYRVEHCRIDPQQE